MNWNLYKDLIAKWKKGKLKRSEVRNFRRFVDERAKDIIKKFVDEKRDLSEPQAKVLCYAIGNLPDAVFKNAASASKLVILKPEKVEKDELPKAQFWAGPS